MQWKTLIEFRNRIFFVFLILISVGSAAKAAQSVIIQEHISIYEKYDAYCAWPAIGRTASGDIVILFTRSEEHMGPNGEILLVRSTDNGETWQPPAIIYDTPIDDRESGLTMMRNGNLLAHFRSVKFNPETYTTLPETAYDHNVLNKWIQYVGTKEYRELDHLSRAWHAVSTDNGLTWSKPTPGKDSIHGGLQLENGSFLVASYRDDKGKVGVYASEEAMGSYVKVSDVLCPTPETLRFGEPHIMQLPSGRIIMMIRATAIPYDDGADRCHLWGTYSDDNGRTWATPYKTPLWGYPPHLLQLSDGRILCTYGYRRPPFGQRACISEDGINWDISDEIILRDDAANKDLGYPVSIELNPGRILSVYYQPNLPRGTNQATHPPSPSRRKPGILGTIWELPKEK